MTEDRSHSSCEHPDEMLSDLVNGELEGPDRRRVALHAAACERCAQILGGLFATRMALHMPNPGRVALPRAFWKSIHARLDEVDGLIRATNGTATRRSAWARPALAFGLAIIAIICVTRAAQIMQPDIIAQMGELHLAATAPLADPGGHQAVGYNPVTHWHARWRNVANLEGHMTMQTVYDVDGLPVSVFRVPAGSVDETRLVQVHVGQEIFFLGALQSSNLAAVPTQGSWEVIVARTPADDLLRLALSRPREVQLDPGL